MNDTAVATAPAVPATDPSLCPACKKNHPGTERTTLRDLAKSHARLERLVKGLDRKGLATSYGPGKWNVRQILCHLRDCELMFAVRWRLILSEDAPPLQPFDQDHWADSTRYDKQDAQDALDAWVGLRAGNLEMLKIAGKNGLARIGRHADYGPITITQMARHLLSHDENHLRQIEAARVNWLAAKRRKRR